MKAGANLDEPDRLPADASWAWAGVGGGGDTEELIICFPACLQLFQSLIFFFDDVIKSAHRTSQASSCNIRQAKHLHA